MFQYFRTLFASVEWRLFSERDKGRQNYDSIQKQGCKRRLQHIQRDFSFECYWEDLCRVHIISRSISCWEAVPWIAAWLPSQQIYYEHDSAVCCISPLLTSPKHLILSEEKGYALMHYSTKKSAVHPDFFLVRSLHGDTETRISFEDGRTQLWRRWAHLNAYRALWAEMWRKARLCTRCSPV